jgi:hypothetical protein
MIVADTTPELMFKDYESMKAGFSFTEDQKNRYTSIQNTTAELNKEIQAEVRKRQSMGVGGIDLSESSSTT